MFKIEKESEIPLYQQLTQEIKRAISEGQLLENDKLMSENEICSTFELSRTTVREALTHLEKEGVIYKKKGKGSFVSSPKIYQNRSTLSKFYDDMKNSGKKPTSKIISAKIKKPSSVIKEKMKLFDDQLIYEIRWVRYGNDEPLIYETINLNYDFVKGIELEDIEEKKLYDILTQKFKIKMTHGEEDFYPCKLDVQEAQNLHLAENDLGMKVKRTVYQGQAVIEYTSSTVRGDRFIYTTNF